MNSVWVESANFFNLAEKWGWKLVDFPGEVE
jgi:hypothetical protein